MKRAYAEITEGQMHYRHAGKGRNFVIFLHMSGSSSDEYEQVGDILATEGYRVYAIDLLAFGGSDLPPSYYSLVDHAQTVVDFMDTQGIDSAYLYGNMATANLAIHVGNGYRNRIKGLMLAHPLYNPDPEHFKRKRTRDEYKVIEPKEDGSHLLEMWSRAAKYGVSASIADERCQCLHQAAEWCETLHWALFEDSPAAELLPKLEVPTVVVAYGAFGEPEMLQEATAMIKDGKFDVYDHGTPYIARTSPEHVAEMFRRHF